MQHPETDLWLSGLLGLVAVVVSLFLHTFFLFIPEPDALVVTRIQFEVLPPAQLEAKAALTSDATSQENEAQKSKPESEVPLPAEPPRPNLEENTQAEVATDTTGWRNRLFRPTRKTLAERNQVAERRMDRRAGLLARTAQRNPWPKAPNSEVAICTPDKTIALDVQTRSIRHWATFLPSALFPPRYAEELHQILGKNSRKQLGRIQRFALPKQFLELPLDDPQDVVLLMGREDIRCALTVAFSKGEHAPFPIRLLQVPLRIVQPNEEVTLHNVDVDFYDDGRFEMTQNSSKTTALPFRKGRIEHTRQLAATFSGWKTLVELSFRALR